MLAETKPGAVRAILTFAWAAAFCGGCSVIFHADADQCSATSDCTARGPSFAGRACVAGQCVAVDAGITASTDAAVDATATTPDTGTDANSGTCNQYLDCPVPKTGHTEVACDVDRHACVQLTTDSCPFVIGDYKNDSMASNLNPIFIGAFATIPASGPTNHPSYLNYALAQADFASQGGIQRGSGSRRMPVIVVCDNSQDPGTIMNHLVNEVHVPAVISSLSSAALTTTFSNTNAPGAPPVFFINPYGADSQLTGLPTNGLLWHILGQPSDLAPAYSAFFPSVEAYVRRAQGLSASTPMRVAAVTANSTDTLDLAKAAKAVLTWNGGASSATTSDCAAGSTTSYCEVQLSASYIDGVDPSTIDVSGAMSALLTFQPNVVISFASEEFFYVFEPLEEGVSSFRPFYLMGAYNADSPSLLYWIASDDTKLRRYAGINFAATANNQVLSDYTTHFLSAYPSGQSSLGADNFYDAAYFAIYSLIAAGPTSPPTGTTISAGMFHLINPTGTSYNVGPTDIGDVSQGLLNGSGNVSLVDTIGPSDFNLNTGARESQGDVYCVLRQTGPLADGGAANPTMPVYADDVLRLTADGGVTGDGGPDGGPSALVGTFPCYSGL